MKKKIIVIFLLLIFPLFIHAEQLTDEQKALQEVMEAYYSRTDKINYNSSLGYLRLSPEEITSQNFGFFDCVKFVMSVYYQALGVNITNSPNAQAVYVNNYKGEHEDIIYWHNKNDPNITNEEFAKKLKVGDIIGYTLEDNVGHVGLVYDIDSSGAPIITHVTSADNTVKDYPNKIDYRGTFQPFNYKFSSKKEGGVKRCNALQDCKGFTNVVNGKYMWIIRPIFSKDGKKYYYNNKCDYSKVNQASSEYKCTYSNLTEYTITDASKARIKYPKIYIGKTVDKVNGSVVTEGSTLKYNIVVKNNSDSNYGSFTIIENIPSYVTVKDISNNGTLSGSKITWNISSLKSKSSISITYSVQVKTGYYGKEIKSTGSVAGIANSTVKNKIGYNLTSTEQSKLKTSFNNLKGKYNGLKLVNEVYKDAFGVDLKLDSNFVLGAQYHKYKLSNGNMFECNYNDSYKNTDKKYNPYYRDYDGDVRVNIHPIIISTTHSTPVLSRKITLNQDSPYYNIVLNNYYSSLHFTYEESTNANGDKVYNGNKRVFTSKGFDSIYYDGKTNTNYITSRTRYINVYNLMNGDVLIYSNRNDPTHTNENGDYAFIYIDGKFVGSNGSVKDIDEINKTRFGTSGYIDNVLQTMFTKDFYVILRPALQMNKVDVSSIKLSHTKLELNVGSSLTISATISPDNATNKTITWSSSNASVATVNNGKITGVKDGTATITAKSNNGKTATCTVTIKSESTTTVSPTTTTPTTETKTNINETKTEEKKTTETNTKKENTTTTKTQNTTKTTNETKTSEPKKEENIVNETNIQEENTSIDNEKITIDNNKEFNILDYILYAAIGLFGILGLMIVVSVLDSMKKK